MSKRKPAGCGEEHLIPARRVHRVKVSVGRRYRDHDRRTYTYHSLEPLRKGDKVEVLGGYYEGQTGTVTRRWSPFYRGYTYEVRKHLGYCPCCGRKKKA